MAVYTVKVSKVCSAGNHIGITVLRNNIPLRQMCFNKSELLDNEVDFEEVLLAFLRQCIKASGASTLAQAKAAVEAAQWVL